VLSLAVIFGWAIAPVAAGIDFVANGSYNLSFGTLATLMILAGLLIAVIKPRASQVAAPTAD
jgi:hypothetical protein